MEIADLEGKVEDIQGELKEVLDRYNVWELRDVTSVVIDISRENSSIEFRREGEGSYDFRDYLPGDCAQASVDQLEHGQPIFLHSETVALTYVSDPSGVNDDGDVPMHAVETPKDSVTPAWFLKKKLGDLPEYSLCILVPQDPEGEKRILAFYPGNFKVYRQIEKGDENDES